LAGHFASAVKDALLPELKEHTRLLGEHSARLDKHEELLQAILAVLREHSLILREHGERLARIEGRMEGLSDRMVDLAAEIRSNLQLRDRVTKIEAHLGLPSSA